MKNTFFVTGTDTDAGKTLVTAAMLQKAKEQSLATIGLKPLAAGLDESAEGYEQDSQGRKSRVRANDDARLLQSLATVKLPYSQINPILFDAPTSPHIAAALEHRKVNTDRLLGLIRGSLTKSYDLALIEGAGGVAVPLNDRDTMTDLMSALGAPVILCVGLKLGCINHSLLSYHYLITKGLQVRGWIGSELENDMPYFAENVETLRQKIGSPCLGVVRHIDKARHTNTLAVVKQAAQAIELPL